MILSNEDRNIILSLLRREVATLNDNGGTCERLVRTFRKAPDKEYVYLVLTETTVYGAWTDPHDAVMWIFDDEPDENLQDAMIKMMSHDYPALIKIPVNPTGEPRSVGIEGNMLIAGRLR